MDAESLLLISVLGIIIFMNNRHFKPAKGGGSASCVVCSKQSELTTARKAVIQKNKDCEYTQFRFLHS